MKQVQYSVVNIIKQTLENPKYLWHTESAQTVACIVGKYEVIILEFCNIDILQRRQ